MTTVLYADVLFVINFSMDFLSIYITAKLLSLHQSPLRFTLAALLGALGATLVTALGITALREAILSVVLSLLMTAVATGFGTAWTFFGKALALWGSGALLGGAVSLLCSLGDVTPVITTAPDSSPYPLLLTLGAFAVTGFVRLIRPRLGRRETSLTLTFDGRSITVRALVDSGNLAADPISATPVMFLCAGECASLIGEGNTAALIRGDREGLDESLLRRLRLIPVDGEDGRRILFAFRPDLVTVGKEQRELFVAVSDKDSAYYGGYPALAPSCAL